MSHHVATLPFIRQSLLTLAIAAFAAGCGQYAQADVHTDAAPTAGSSDAAAERSVADDAHHAAGEHAAGDHAAHAATLPAPPATPWPSDASLREGMRRMQRAVGALGHAEHSHLNAAQTTAAAQQVQDAANFMITNCKLAPEPDAALHGVLATLLRGAAALKANPTDSSPVASMRDAVALYPRLFVDAAWQADTAPAQ